MSSTPSTPELLRITPTRAVWRVAWPMIALGLLRTCYYLTDSYWVGQLGPDALAAIGGAAFAWWMIHLSCDLAGTGAQALVARHEGGGRREGIAPTLAQGLWLAAVVALLLATAGWSLRGLYFDLLGFERGTAEHDLGQEYLGACLLGAATLSVHYVTAAAFRGLGHTRTALGITIVTLIANAILDPVLIWGWGPAPALGVAGAAWATAAANGLGAVVSLWVLAAWELRLRWTPPDLAAIRRIAAIGAPVTAAGIGFSMVYVLLGRFITDFGPEQMAALGVGHRLESAGFLVCVGFSVGAATMVGQNLGAGRPEQAAQAAHAAARLCVLAMLPIAVGLWVGAEPLFGLFTDDPATTRAGVVYLRFQVPVLMFMGAEVAYEGAFSGAGDTVPSFWIGFGWTAARIPAAWLLAYPLGMGVSGVWLAVALSTAIKGVHMSLWFRRGRWVHALE